MDPERLKQLLVDVSRGQTTVDDAVAELRALPFRDLGFARADTTVTCVRDFPRWCWGRARPANRSWRS